MILNKLKLKENILKMNIEFCEVKLVQNRKLEQKISIPDTSATL